MSDVNNPVPGKPVRSSTAAAPGLSATHDEASIPDLLRTLTDQGSHLASQQVALVKAEIGESIDDLKIGIVALVGAAVVGIAALGVFLMALGHLLGELLGDKEGLGLLIVSLVVLVIAFVMYKSAMAKMDATNLAPTRTQHTLERTPDAATGNL